MHARGHRSFAKLLAHCSEFNSEELHREIPGFGYGTLQLQLHHMIGAQDYWIRVALGNMLEEDKPEEYPTVESLVTYRDQVVSMTDDYLRSASEAELNTERSMTVWTDMQENLMPAQVFMRTLTHMYHHQGQVLAMCRLLGRPLSDGMDFPLK